MTDVFVATIADEPIRMFLAKAVLARWAKDSEAEKIILQSTPPMGRWVEFLEEYIQKWRYDWVPGVSDQMQKQRRIEADNASRAEVYIVTDDDCMPIGVDFIARGLAVMAAHPAFGILAAMNYWNRNDPEPYTGRFIDADVWECHAVGGIRFCRKGIIQEWPESVAPGSYDCQHHEALVNAGYRAGYMRNVQMSHLGIGLSQHWPEVSEVAQLYRNEKVAV